MIIVSSMDHLLHRDFEGILVLELPSLDALRYIIERSYDINGRLLVASRRILEVFQCALKLEGVIVIM